ncbi:DnaB-like helicase N-terminal domain-containing protein [Hoyosella altamirensis]|uniref:DNA helicase DnaB-like N-terminal domain-containing protein n=1 Tax=Hoyosella altamirensis TaxID=616997 RepID=A0A839RMS2_9ACTN|nr:DnaB-like helicase N-terminal domain-containing protein [Hoyosella altamirensis]MBB3037437.1 hypothetical protein [Hoyosella altamirensis]MBB3037454.1 hypothetical protein [Hoyosella altamirensis]
MSVDDGTDIPEAGTVLLACLCAVSSGRYSYPNGRDLEDLAELLLSSDFHRPAEGRAYAAILEHHDRGDPHDLVTLHAQFLTSGAFTEPGGRELAALMLDLVTADDAIRDGTAHPQRVRTLAAAVVAEAHRRAASVDMSAAIAGHPPSDWLTVWRDHGTKVAGIASRFERLIAPSSKNLVEVAA